MRIFFHPCVSKLENEKYFIIGFKKQKILLKFNIFRITYFNPLIFNYVIDKTLISQLAKYINAMKNIINRDIKNARKFKFML